MCFVILGDLGLKGFSVKGEDGNAGLKGEKGYFGKLKFWFWIFKYLKINSFYSR